MQRNKNAKFFPVFIIIVIAIVLIIGVISVGRSIFQSGGDSSSEKPKDDGRAQMLDTSDGHSVRLTVRGPIVAQENFSSYTIDASNGQRSMKVYKGYLDEVQKDKTLPNNQQAYEQFVYALDKANIMKGTVPDDDAKNDLRGICATGYVYEYSVIVNGETAKRLWTSTCSGSKGSLDASTSQLNDLFLNQIPDSKTLVPFDQSPLQLKF